MRSLEEARDWYQTTRSQLSLFGRLGNKYWDVLPWDGPLGKDNSLRDLDGEVISRNSKFGLEHLEDLAVLVLFSVFESIVRAQVLSIVETERARLNNVHITSIIDNAVDGIETGSFYRILEVCKKTGDPDLVNLIEEVNQVRRYRNWVAHGKRSARPETVDPGLAYLRLKRFLDEILKPAS